MRIVTAVRQIGDTRFERTLTLPVDPAERQIVRLGDDEFRIAAVAVEPIAEFRPGIKRPSVTIYFPSEPYGDGAAHARATGQGWTAVAGA